MASSAFQNRFLLTLDSEPTSELIRKVLKSPLGLSHKITKCLFENDFEKLRNELDSIKEFVAGVTRAEKLGKDYTLARFYPSLFAFHQFFQSSYRARQGKTLEEFIKEILRETDPSLQVPDKRNDKIRIMAETFTGYTSKGDIDVLVRNNSKVMAIQLRSNVNTGGTSAKSSLVEVFRTVLSLSEVKNHSFFYHIAVWEKEGNQKNITKSKIYDTLEHLLTPLRISKNKFITGIENGITIKPNVFLKLSFGTTEILKSVKKWLGNPENLKDSAIKDMTTRLENWDDLWLSYAIASIEIETQKIKGLDNIIYLNELLGRTKYNTGTLTKSEEFVNIANELALKIIPLWKQESIPLASPSDKAHYIRDLILLKLIYEHL